jgi:molybdopterin synthase catalytic subunit/molybdopterin converting factor small subunit
VRITVVYLGGSRVQSGCAREVVEVGSGATVADIARAVLERHPALVPLAGNVRWARNHAITSLEESVQDADEIALLPPVAGGNAKARVTDQPLDVTAAIEAVRSPGAGAIVTFVGTVRDNHKGKHVRQITYEAYEPMATRELDRLCVELEREHVGVRLFVAHRHGVLPVGEMAIVIAASSAHREAAFVATRSLLERIKTDVPIWKNELTEDGESWVGWGGG